MKILYAFLLSIIFLLCSCNSTFLKPSEEVDFDYTKYYINLDYSSSTTSVFKCEDILYSIENSSGKDMLCIRGRVNPNALRGISECIEKNKLLVYVDLRYASYHETISNKTWYDYFKDKTNLKAIYLPYDIREISFNVFKNCSNLETLIIPASLSLMRPYMFANCTKLKTVVYYGKKIGFIGGDRPGESWSGIPPKQMTLYLANLERKDVSDANMNPNPPSGYGTWPKWAGYQWKEVKFKGEFDEKAITR